MTLWDRDGDAAVLQTLIVRLSDDELRVLRRNLMWACEQLSGAYNRTRGLVSLIDAEQLGRPEQKRTHV